MEWIGKTFVIGWSFTILSAAGGFFLKDLPPGRSVTLPTSVTTIAPLSSRIQLTATDLPQTVKISGIPSGNHVPPLTLAFYSNESDRVRYIALRQGKNVLYQFDTLTSIHMVPQTSKSTRYLWQGLQIESNKPLKIGH